MKRQNCNLCGESKNEIYVSQSFEDPYLKLIDSKYNLITRYIYRCESCSHLYRSPVLDSADLKVLYTKFRDMSFRSESPDDYFDRINNLPKEKSENHSKVQWLKINMQESFNNTKSILDIGCGGGVFIKKLMDELKGKCKYFGIEPTPSFAKLAAKRLGIPLHRGEYKANIFSQKFDLITANQVLEHVLDPLEFMRNINNDLKDNGYAYIEVPDISDLKELDPTHDRFMMQHVSIFSEESLSKLMKSSNFVIKKIEVVKTVRERNNLVCLVSKD